MHIVFHIFCFDCSKASDWSVWTVLISNTAEAHNAQSMGIRLHHQRITVWYVWTIPTGLLVGNHIAMLKTLHQVRGSNSAIAIMVFDSLYDYILAEHQRHSKRSSGGQVWRWPDGKSSSTLPGFPGELVCVDERWSTYRRGSPLDDLVY